VARLDAVIGSQKWVAEAGSFGMALCAGSLRSKNVLYLIAMNLPFETTFLERKKYQFYCATLQNSTSYHTQITLLNGISCRNRSYWID
jgi:hypothetical protein